MKLYFTSSFDLGGPCSKTQYHFFEIRSDSNLQVGILKFSLSMLR